MLFLGLFFGLISVAAAVQKPPTAADDVTPVVVPNAYIVQIKNESSVPLSSVVGRSIDHHALFHKRAAPILNYDIRTEFRSPDLFYGLTINVKEPLTADEVREKLTSIQDVLSVTPVTVVRAPTPYGISLPLSVTAAASKPNSGNHSARVVGKNYFPKIQGPDFDPSSALRMAGVDKVHALGVKGAGIKIGIIDTGIDYAHPSLGGAFGPGKKVAGGYDFVGDSYNGTSGTSPVPDNDPLATCLNGGHGTHVAGIIAMEDPAGTGFGLTGVAPDAELFSYRVFSCLGYSSTELILQALDRAGNDGVDVINMSTGAYWNFQKNDPYSAMISGLRRRGIATIAANGNNGWAGIYYTSTPGISVGAIAVGSISNTKFPVTYKANDTAGHEFQYASVWPIEGTEPLDIYLIRDTDPQGCSAARGQALAKEIPNTSKTIIFLDGRGCFSKPWLGFGFDFLGVLNNDTDAFVDQYRIEARTDFSDTRFISLRADDAVLVRLAYAEAGGYGNYKWTLGRTEASSPLQNLTGGMMSNYSNFGPPIDTMALKPQLSAPGGNILSLYPVGNYSGYAILSGTSMSTPFVTGCYALIKSKFPHLSVSEIQDLMQTTSVPVPWVPDTSILSTAVHQGAGLINAYRAITYESSISPGELSIGDTDDYVSKPRNFTVTNHSGQPKTYVFSHQGAGYAEYFPYQDLLPDPNNWYLYGQPQYARYGTADFSQASVELAPGQSTTINVTFSPPRGVNAARNPITSGFIKVSSSSDDEQFVIPYAGLPYSRFNATYFDSSKNLGPPYPLTTIDVALDGDNYTVSGDVHVYTWNGTEGGNGPWIVLNTFHLTQELRMDILPANTTFVPDFDGVSPGFKLVDYRPSEDPVSSTFLGTPTFGYATRGFDQLPKSKRYGWFNKVIYRNGETDAGQMKKGDYRVLLSVRRWNGDVTQRGSWVTYLSPVVRYIDV